MYTDIFVHNGFSFSSLLLYTFEDKYFKISEMEDVTLLTCCGQILTINVKFWPINIKFSFLMNILINSRKLFNQDLLPNHSFLPAVMIEKPPFIPHKFWK